MTSTAPSTGASGRRRRGGIWWTASSCRSAPAAPGRCRNGHVFRIVTIEGPQVADLNIWNRHNPRERFWASRTRQIQQARVSIFDRLWSTLPYLRPLATITHDTLADYGIDEYGRRVHDLLGTRCDPYVNRMLTGEDFHHHCHSNLTRAVRTSIS
ncbi:urea carboxylase-associated family protein [Azospirillum sp. B506]|uniref:urea carboxylase-associated family protein n=1 Tax=Azospirillum sp. B506 TaxID=137721 RepID=UPI00034D0D9E|nr:urea carboxylase-associated family protein [Azospirillum sp. B506]